MMFSPLFSSISQVSTFLSFAAKHLTTVAAAARLAQDFFYLPMNRRHRQGIGYAFINFQEKGTADIFKDVPRPIIESHWCRWCPPNVM